MTDDIAAELIDEFSWLDEWEDRYAHLIALGKALPALPDALRNEATQVPGCASQVWLAVHLTEDAPARLALFADSDSHIVKGLAAVLHRLYDGRPVERAGDIDPQDVFAQLGLREHLTAQRANGLASMIDRLKGHIARVS